MRIRPEQRTDFAVVRQLNLSAFGTSLEADLVDALRGNAQPIVSLVADDDGHILGHIMFSPVTLLSDPVLPIMGLAPMAVVAARRRQGVGSALVRDGLERCRALGAKAIVVLGHAEYYPRFGFAPASRLGLGSEYRVPDEVFMGLELEPGSLHGKTGTVRYHPAFPPP